MTDQEIDEFLEALVSVLPMATAYAATGMSPEEVGRFRKQIDGFCDDVLKEIQ